MGNAKIPMADKLPAPYIHDFLESQNQQLYNKIIEGIEKEREENCQHKWEDIVCIGITGKIMCNECEETLLSTKIKSIKL